MKLFHAFTLAALIVSSSMLCQDNPQTGLGSNQTKAIKSIIESDRDRLITIYKDLHQHPELGFNEVRTPKFVAKSLKELGFEVKTGIGKTGVVGILKNGAGPVLMYRADMDAIATEEQTGLPYASQKRVLNADGVEVPAAHLCGHDAHVTRMLSMATVIVRLKDQWKDTLVLVSQPAEVMIEGDTCIRYIAGDSLLLARSPPENVLQQPAHRRGW